MQDEVDTSIKPHAEDPGTPDLISMQLPQGSINRKAVLQMHREMKRQHPVDRDAVQIDLQKPSTVPIQNEVGQKVKALPKLKASPKSSPKAKVKVKNTTLKDRLGNQGLKVICFQVQV